MEAWKFVVRVCSRAAFRLDWGGLDFKLQPNTGSGREVVSCFGLERQILLPLSGLFIWTEAFFGQLFWKVAKAAVWVWERQFMSSSEGVNLAGPNPKGHAACWG